MTRWMIAAGAFALVLAAVATYAVTGGKWPFTPTPPGVEERRAELAAIDPADFARKAAGQNDFRLAVAVNGDYAPDLTTPGVTCAIVPKVRREITHWDRDLLDEKIAFAVVFNRTLVAHPNFPDKDICIGDDEPAQDIAAKLKSPERRPKPVDIYTAVRAQNEPAVRRFIAEGADLERADRWQMTPLMWAVVRDNLQVLDALLAAGAKPATPVLTDSALVRAVKANNMSALRRLLESGPTGTHPDGERESWYPHRIDPIIVAAATGQINAMRLLVDFKAIPETSNRDAWGWILAKAVQNDCDECLALVLHTAARDVVNGNLALREALNGLQASHPDNFARIVRLAGGIVGRSNVERQALLAAAKADRTAALRLIAVRGRDVNLLSSHEAVELIAAAERDDAPVLERLLAIAAERRVALIDALAKSDLATLRRLLPPGASLDQESAFTPLMEAARTGNAKGVEALLSLGAPINTRLFGDEEQPGYQGITALGLALKAGHGEAAMKLLLRGADVDLAPQDFPNAQLFAAHYDAFGEGWREELTNALLAAPPASSRQTRLNQMLNAAPTSNKLAAVKDFLARGAEPCVATKWTGRDPMINAAAQGDTELFETLYRACRLTPGGALADQHVVDHLVNLMSGGGLLSDESAGMSKQAAIVRRLLSDGARMPDTIDGTTPICAAAMFGGIDLVRLLIERHVAINRVCEFDHADEKSVGGTPLDFAHSKEMSALLREHGAKSAAELNLPTREKPAQPFPF